MEDEGIIVYNGSYVNFTVKYWERDRFAIKFHETCEDPCYGKTITINANDSDRELLKREVAFIIYNNISEESARIEMREMFLSGHVPGKMVYIVNSVMSKSYLDKTDEPHTDICGKIISFTTATQCIHFCNTEFAANNDEVWSVSILPLNNWKSKAVAYRHFTGNRIGELCW